ncbi:MAG: helix-turn-helix transcriptional regulator [Chitinophagaceae bacterium]
MGQSAGLVTPREKEVLQLLAKGMTYREIALQLGVTAETIKKHLKNIYQKLQVQNKIKALNKFRLL